MYFKLTYLVCFVHFGEAQNRNKFTFIIMCHSDLIEIEICMYKTLN